MSSDNALRVPTCFVICYLEEVLGQSTQEFSMPQLVSELHPCYCGVLLTGLQRNKLVLI
jgi:hypothetical protein